MRLLHIVHQIEQNCYLLGWFRRNKKDMPEAKSAEEEFRKRLKLNAKAKFREFVNESGENEEQEFVRNESVFDFSYFEVSAKTGENIEEAVFCLLREILKEKKYKLIESKREVDFGKTIIQLDKREDVIEKQKEECCK